MKRAFALIGILAFTGCGEERIIGTYSSPSTDHEFKIKAYRMMAEFWNKGDMLFNAPIIKLRFSDSDDFPHGTIELTDGSAADDTYGGLEVRINGAFVGCVHDYDGKTKEIVFGKCFDRRDYIRN